MGKVIWHNAASPPQTDGPIIFDRLRQCASLSSTPNRHSPRTVAAPWWIALSISTTGHVLACPVPAPFRPQNRLFTCEHLDPSNIWFLGPARVNIASGISIGSVAFAGFTVGQTDRQTDRQRFSVCSNKPHLASAAMRLNNRVKFLCDRSNRCWGMAIFRFSQNCGRPPSWICYVPDWTTYNEYLMVFITVQNLVEIDTVVSIIYKYWYFC